MRINTAQFRNEFYRNAKRKQVNRAVFIAAKKEFESRKQALINDFDNNEVTEAIKAGPDSPGDGVMDEYGNLYSYIGFDGDEGLEQIEDLRRELENGVEMKQTPQTTQSGAKLNYQFSVNVPSQKDIESITPSPFGSGSWASRLEKSGIGGYARYLFDLLKDFPNSRSGPAVQLKNKDLRGDKNIKAKFILSLINAFKKTFR